MSNYKTFKGTLTNKRCQKLKQKIEEDNEETWREYPTYRIEEFFQKLQREFIDSKVVRLPPLYPPYSFAYLLSHGLKGTSITDIRTLRKRDGSGGSPSDLPAVRLASRQRWRRRRRRSVQEGRVPGEGGEGDGEVLKGIEPHLMSSVVEWFSNAYLFVSHTYLRAFNSLR